MVSLNIRMGRLGVLETELWALHQSKVGMGLLQETKLAQGIYTRIGVG